MTREGLEGGHEVLDPTEQIKEEVAGLLEKARDMRTYLLAEDAKDKSTKDFRGERKQSKIERIQMGDANEIEVASRANVEKGLVLIGDMIRDLEAAEQRLDAGQRNIDPLTRVDQVIDKYKKIWEKEFTAPKE